MSNLDTNTQELRGWDSGLLTFLTIASGDPKTWATNPQIPMSILVRIS
jgi:hypothetical protein